LDLQKSAQGEDSSPVSNEGERKSLSVEETYDSDIQGWDQVGTHTRQLSEDLGNQLRSEKLKARTFQVKIRYSDFSTVLRAQTLPQATSLTQDIYDLSLALLEAHLKPNLKVRLLGIAARNFEDGEDAGPPQLNLFDDGERKEKLERLDSAKDELKRRFGTKVLS
jgi:DNA polymerase-4